MREACNVSQSMPMETHLLESKQNLMHPHVIGSIEGTTFISIIHLSENYSGKTGTLKQQSQGRNKTI